MAAGYFQVTPYVPGIGAHYLNIGYVMDDGFDPAEPEMLLYNGNEPTSVLVGLSYARRRRRPARGLHGPQRHVARPPVAVHRRRARRRAPTTRPRTCASRSARRRARSFGADMWMAHLWQVPGWESPWGLFSGENPVVNLATTDVGR